LEEHLSAKLPPPGGRRDTADERTSKGKKRKKSKKHEKHKTAERQPNQQDDGPELHAAADAPDAPGWLAFAPTPEGFRLLEVAGSTPEVGDAVDLPELDGSLVVTRVGRSPLPFDGRACAFLDRA
jgi:hypothetical protein